MVLCEHLQICIYTVLTVIIEEIPDVTLQSNNSCITESDVWSVEEIDRYTRAILTHDKDFFSVANDVSILLLFLDNKW